MKKVILGLILIPMVLLVGCSNNNESLTLAVEKELKSHYPQFAKISLFGLKPINEDLFVVGFALQPINGEIQTGVKFVEKKGNRYIVKGGSNNSGSTKEIITFGKLETTIPPNNRSIEVFHGAIVNKNVYLVEIEINKHKTSQRVYGKKGYLFYFPQVHNNFIIRAYSKEKTKMFELKYPLEKQD